MQLFLFGIYYPALKSGAIDNAIDFFGDFSSGWLICNRIKRDQYNPGLKPRNRIEEIYFLPRSEERGNRNLKSVAIEIRRAWQSKSEERGNGKERDHIF